MKTQILNLLSSGQKLTTNEIATQLGSLNRIVYPILMKLASQSQVRRLSPENGSFGVATSWILFA
jgi:hypothetical protein